MTSPSEPKSFVPSPAPTPIRWQSWPLRDERLRALLLLIGIVAVGLLVQTLTGRVYLSLLAVAVLMIASWRFFLPVVIELSDEGVSQQRFGRQHRTAWQSIRRYEVCSTGVLLLPDEDRSILASFRGLFLPWATHRDEVLAHVHHHLDQPARPGLE
jgi:hypothetical protein